MDASKRGFFGSIPAELGQLANLQALLLQDRVVAAGAPQQTVHGWQNLLANLLLCQENNLSCPIPPELGRLGELRILNLPFDCITAQLAAEYTRLAAFSVSLAFSSGAMSLETCDVDTSHSPGHTLTDTLTGLILCLQPEVRNAPAIPKSEY